MSDKPREWRDWWVPADVLMPANGRGYIAEHIPDIHVIEYSAYTELKAQLERAKAHDLTSAVLAADVDLRSQLEDLQADTLELLDIAGKVKAERDEARAQRETAIHNEGRLNLLIGDIRAQNDKLITALKIIGCPEHMGENAITAREALAAYEADSGKGEG